MIAMTGNKKQAFTLIEILLALLIFVIGSVSLWALFISAIETHKRAIDEQQAALLAETLVAELRQQQIVKHARLEPIKDGTHPGFPGYRYNVVFSDLGQQAVLVALTIGYRRHGRRHEEFFRTVVYRRFGNPR